MVQLAGNFFASLGMIAIRFILGAQAIPTDPVYTLSACWIRWVDVIGKYEKPPIGGLFACCAKRPRNFAHDQSPMRESQLSRCFQSIKFMKQIGHYKA